MLEPQRNGGGKPQTKLRSVRKSSLRRLTPTELEHLAKQLPGASRRAAAAIERRIVAGFYGGEPGDNLADAAKTLL